MARALYATTPMGAPLYTVYREDDRLSTKIITVNSKGMADTDAQDAFCNGQWGHCIVLKIFDQRYAAPQPCHGAAALRGRV